MAAERVIVSGVVRNGVVVPEGEAKLPEGVHVEILMPVIPPELQAEFDAWEAANDEDFAAFEAMLKEEEKQDA
ncbi:MAG: hypothetical protein NZT92_05875 [Abditibacteriales bacterium]|nr:hypothetical protein [Abditibacteriales bacterium]MDW8364822.1 hypothetical protein [Abditibacteriales bacterium]